VGIVGGGQLGRMLALAAAPLGVRCSVLDPAADACAAIAAEHIAAPFDDVAALRRLAAASDVVTFEFENVPAAVLAAIGDDARLAPTAGALRASQDRLTEKRLFERVGIATAPYAAVESLTDLRTAIARIGTPAILKTRRLGYDGKGQVSLSSPGDAEQAWAAISRAPAILEGRVEFAREFSQIAVRSTTAETAYYPLTENLHRDGILRESRVPASAAPDALAATARDYAESLMNELDYAGVLALELFATGDGRLLANEFAPRVHNSGHWTIDGAPASQFENHIRAVLGLPLGAVAPAANCVMLNLIGEAPDSAAVLGVPGAHLHLYGKRPRPGRKIGHITLTEARPGSIEDGLARLRPLVDAAAA
ncbi:MAG: 5-(carboxyamino)imidazole ribonucleotide synthase, partial [Solirubrobacterales bacterium]